ncbi:MULTISPECIES: hypothetical protein [Reichenbachiella]|uniref:Uncharacterized protein n=1 Tax=Reichenbachiella agariperforans TaxID=156994 RepID=A0A1M6VE29_REIAG|nr:MULTISPECIES: hypothetical protein [Reichenbachiella]MBU2914867.1 hypothetical protein [Reichenbachiella agariperforans]RJE75247.1 hypothetical protein BGP76_19310 [Reichenbachiella sp. MSK19-1]SHK79742.1 hypothetical protein SAMN04488028_10914 [Reichenbachiella agariperforans]
MSDHLPYYIYIVFLLTTLATFAFLHFGFKSAEPKKSNVALIISICLVVWLFIIGTLSLNAFFVDYETIPPKFVLAIMPPNLFVMLLFISRRSRNFIRQIPITTLTYLHLVRVPVEIVLWWLALEHWLPMLMTFEGSNYDILSGITAPFVAIFMVGLRSKVKIGAIIWNFLALGLLVTIVYHALFSTPFPFQKFAFDQPNIAVFYFPFIWLPAFIVPAVLFSHLAALYQLFSKSEESI